MRNAYEMLSILRGRKLTDEFVKKRYEETIKMIDVSEQNYERQNKLDSALRDHDGNIITTIINKKEQPLTYRMMLDQQRQETHMAYEQIKYEESRQQYDKKLEIETQQKKEEYKVRQQEEMQRISELAEKYNIAITKQKEAIERLNQKNLKTEQPQVRATAKEKNTIDYPTVRGRNIKWNKTKWEDHKRKDGEAR